MNFLKYSNDNMVNIIPKEDFDQLIQEVFKVISDNLSKSIGPLGSSTTILDGMYTSATKDGYSIFKSIRFHNRYKNMIYNLIKGPCTMLNNTVGDGTTTSVVLTNYLFQHYQAKKNGLEGYYRLPRQFTQAWNEIVGYLIEKIQSYAKPLDPSDYESIFNLCYVTSNGNSEISHNIANTYKVAKSPTIKLKNSPTNKSYITPVTGFEFPANLIDEGYARNEDLSVDLSNISIMIFDHKIESDFCKNFLIPLNEILKPHQKKLLVLAPSYDALLMNTIMHQYMNHEYQKHQDLNLILGQYQMGKLDPHQLVDLSTVLRTKVITQDIGKSLSDMFNGLPDGKRYDFIEKTNDTKFSDKKFEFYRILGTCESALLSCTNGSIFKVKDIENDEKYKDALRVAQKELQDVMGRTDHEKQNFSFEVSKAQARISQLKMENYIYYIGSDSTLQTNIIYDLVDDVVKCIRSAIKSGVVPGCQLSIIKACMEEMKEIVDNTEGISLSDYEKLQLAILEIIQDSVLNVYSTILHGPEKRGMIKLIPRWQYTTDEGLQELLNEAQEKCLSIIKESIEANQAFDLETLKLSDKIITSAETDINVLIASSELVKLLISGNQCIFLDTDVNSAHDEKVEMYA